MLLAGPVGVGKRAAARWMAATSLGRKPSRLPVHPQDAVEHADLRWIAPLEDKESIGIEQIRELVHAMALTSYEGGGKVAVIEPANAMTVNAANSLLKTLEEPPGDALLILVADRVGKLPATIFSRCQRIDLPRPRKGLRWHGWTASSPARPGARRCEWPEGRPLAAIGALEDLETSASMARDLNALGKGMGSAVEVAARWTKLAPGSS